MVFASLVALLTQALAGPAVGQGCTFEDGDIYFNQIATTLGLPASQVGLSKLDTQSCSATTVFPGLVGSESFPKYDPFRDAILVPAYASGVGFVGTKFCYCDGTVADWNVTGTNQGSIRALAPKGDGTVYAVSNWGIYLVLGYVDLADAFHPLLDPMGALVPIEFGSSEFKQDLMYSAKTNTLVYIIPTYTGAPCLSTTGLQVTWFDLDAAGTGLASAPTTQTSFAPCGGVVDINTRMARTQGGTFVFVMRDTGAANYEIVELDPVTKTKETFGFITPSQCLVLGDLSFSINVGLAFDDASQQVIVTMHITNCFGFPDGGNHYELRGFTRSLTPSLGTPVCAFPTYSSNPNDPYPPAPWGVGDLFDISSPGGVWKNIGFGLAGTSGVPNLKGTGTMVAGSPGSLALSNANPLSPALLFMSLTSTPVPFKGGTLAANPWLLTRFVFTNGSGAIPLSWSAWPGGIPSNTSLYFQYAIQDAAGPVGVSLSNAVKATTP